MPCLHTWSVLFPPEQRRQDAGHHQQHLGNLIDLGRWRLAESVEYHQRAGSFCQSPDPAISIGLIVVGIKEKQNPNAQRSRHLGGHDLLLGLMLLCSMHFPQ